jgi:hypothetical protein
MNFEKTQEIGRAWLAAEEVPPADGGRDRTLTWIAVIFFAQALPFVLALAVTGGC